MLEPTMEFDAGTPLKLVARGPPSELDARRPGGIAR